MSETNGTGPNCYPFKNVAALYEWQEIAEPEYGIWRISCWWIADLYYSPWQKASELVPVLSNLPNYAVLHATIPATGGVTVLYECNLTDRWTDLIYVG